MGDDLDVGGGRYALSDTVVFVTNHFGNSVAVLKAGTLKHPGGCVANNPVGRDRIAFVIVPDERTLGVRVRGLAETGGDLSGVFAVERITRRVPVVDHLPAGTAWGILEADPSIHIVCAEETEVHAGIASGFQVRAHLHRVVLVVSRDDDAAMVQSEFATLMKIDVGPVGDVVTDAFHEPDELKLAAEEFATAVAGVRAIEADHISPSAVAGVDAGAAPTVVGLPRRHRALHEEI